MSMSLIAWVALFLAGVILAYGLWKAFRDWVSLSNVGKSVDLLLKSVGAIAALGALEFFVLLPELELPTTSAATVFDSEVVRSFYSGSPPSRVNDLLKAIDSGGFEEPGADEPLNIENDDRHALCEERLAGFEFLDRYGIDCPPYSDSIFDESSEAFATLRKPPHYAWALVEGGFSGSDLMRAIDAIDQGFFLEAGVTVTNTGPGTATNVRIEHQADFSPVVPPAEDPALVELRAGESETFVYRMQLKGPSDPRADRPIPVFEVNHGSNRRLDLQTIYTLLGSAVVLTVAITVIDILRQERRGNA